MKVTAIAQFDKKVIESLKDFKEWEPFVDYVIAFNQNVDRILRGNVSIGDNILADTKNITCVSNVPSTIAPKPNQKPQRVTLDFQDSGVPLNFTWSFDDKGQVVFTPVTLTPLVPPTKSFNVRLSIYY